MLGRTLYLSKLRSQETRFGKPPVVILTIGKVGSKTVRASIVDANPDRHVYHLHHLSEDILGIFAKDINTNRKRAEYVWKCRHIRDQVINANGPERTKVVTLVREPVARNLSDFFQNASVKKLGAGEYLVSSAWHNFEVTVREGQMDDLYAVFFDKYQHEVHSFYFDREFRDIIGIDFYWGAISQRARVHYLPR